MTPTHDLNEPCNCKDPIQNDAHHNCDKPCHWADNCPVPRRLNRAVAERLGTITFSLIRDPIEGRLLNQVTVEHFPNYVEDIQAAWEIVDNIKETELFALCFHDGQWHCEINCCDGKWPIDEEAETPSLAIVKAFLKLDGRGARK